MRVFFVHFLQAVQVFRPNLRWVRQLDLDLFSRRLFHRAFLFPVALSPVLPILETITDVELNGDLLLNVIIRSPFWVLEGVHGHLSDFFLEFFQRFEPCCLCQFLLLYFFVLPCVSFKVRITITELVLLGVFLALLWCLDAFVQDLAGETALDLLLDGCLSMLGAGNQLL